jgi:hypothetical protein
MKTLKMQLINLNKMNKFLFLIFIIPLWCFSQPQLKPFTIKLDSKWHFATDNMNIGVNAHWFSVDFNDTGWGTVKSGISWQQQGIVYGGYAWYRQKLVLPSTPANVPLTLNLGQIFYDHDVYFNGVKVGGLKGSYRYTNFNPSYIIPASLLRFGTSNTIAVRVLGVEDRGYDGAKSGLSSGAYTLKYDPYLVMMRRVSGGDKRQQDSQHFDLSDAQYGMPFEIILSLPDEKFRKNDSDINFTLADHYGGTIQSGLSKITIGKDGIPHAIVAVSKNSSQTIYFRGRFKVYLTANDQSGRSIYSDTLELNQLSFKKRDHKTLPVLAETYHDTPYGKLKLVDEIKTENPVAEDEHPYMQSGFNTSQHFKTPGSPVEVTVKEILGKKARESEYGWFAYRIGRGKLKPHHTYLVRMEYPEDKPRYCPVEISTGENYMDIGWKNGYSSDSPYDNWPLSHKWEWYDSIISLDDYTTGTTGANGASSEHGIWVYFMNKRNLKGLFPMYEGGTAISRIRLYEIDPEKNAPVINKPDGLPQRTLMMDWERQAVHQNPSDVVQYCKLMGYNTVSPVILKWAFANYSTPLNGYHSFNVDNNGYWVQNSYNPSVKQNVGPAVRGKLTVYEKYLNSTKQLGINFVPRIEYGGSFDLPDTARAIGPDGKLAKPNRFADWGANLLNPATWEDMSRLIDHLFKPYFKVNPQLTGTLWRIRSDRMQASYGREDIELFAKETGARLPGLSDQELAAWASTGEGRNAYTDWWHTKRTEFQEKISNQLKSYRPDMKLYYYNWDGDKFSLGLPDFTLWAFLSKVMNAKPDVANAIYEENFRLRRKFTGKDYIQMIKMGNLLPEMNFKPDYGLRPELYKNLPGIEVLAPANYRYLAGDSTYLNYFKTREGLAVSNMMEYDEVNSRSANPRFECNEVTPGGAAYSMAMELLSYFNGDARTLTYTSYTYGRGFADAHRRFAKAFLSLPAIEGTVIEGTDKDVKVRIYPSKNGTYVGVANKAYLGKKVKVKLPGILKNRKRGSLVKDLVSGKELSTVSSGNDLLFDLDCDPMGLHTFIVR